MDATGRVKKTGHSSIQGARRALQRNKKQQARADIRKELNASKKDSLWKKSQLIAKKLEALSVYKKAKVMMFYWALPGEPDLRMAIRRAKKQGKIVALPVVVNEKLMQPYEFTLEKNMEKNFLGIREPIKQTSVKLALKDLDLILVPGVAFDKNGKRLGRGKGYYDRFLKKLTARTSTIGVAFACQILKRLPFNPLRDQKVDMVISA